MKLVEKADGKSKAGKRRKSNYHRFLKKEKNKIERRKAKSDPECAPTYGVYRGWET